MLNSKPRNLLEVARIARHEGEVMDDRSRGDQGVSDTCSVLATKAAGALRDGPIDGYLGEGGKHQPNALLVDMGTGENLAARYDRIPEAVVACDKGVSTAQVINKNVGVNQEISHDPTRRAEVRSSEA